MSSDATTAPITPARFAAALKDLSAENLALKVFELRNSIAHLDYSNAELRPYAEGLVTVIGGGGGDGDSAAATTADSATQPPQQQQQGDQDCIDAIAENEVVIARMLERIDLIRVEVLGRGLSWNELSGVLPERDDPTVGVVPQTMPVSSTLASASAGSVNGVAPALPPTTNGTSSSTTTTTSATVQGAGDARSGAGEQPQQQQQQQQHHEAWRDGTFTAGTIRAGGPGLSDEELLRRLQAQIPGLGDDGDEEDGGMHL
ncbi:hypothetical protein MN608_04111 [Microdochium nivale]|nr:hypothetical protein MN608_04111 [Microdochium nivale]